MKGSGKDTVFTSLWFRTDGVRKVTGHWFHGGGFLRAEEIHDGDDTYGCRTDICGAYCFRTEQEAQEDVDERAERLKRKAESHPHGTLGRYHGGCRCDRCVGAHKENVSERAALRVEEKRRRAEDEERKRGERVSGQRVIDGLAERVATLSRQLAQMTANRATALEENERKRDVIQGLQQRLSGREEAIRVLEMRLGEIIHQRAQEELEERAQGMTVELSVPKSVGESLLRQCAMEEDERPVWDFLACEISQIYGEGDDVTRVVLYPRECKSLDGR